MDYLGGSQYGYLLLTSLETLAAVEETVVRDKAVESASKIAARLPAKHLEEFYIPMVRRLSAGDWFTSRTSACGLFAAAYPLVNAPHQEELRKLYKTLCADDTPMVRRAATTHLAVYFIHVEIDQGGIQAICLG